MRPPVIWSIAGTDSGGGAGLAADQRAADAFGVHLCPVVAAVTAQHSRGVTHVEPMSEAVLDAQLAALDVDMPPVAVKTGLLGNAAQVRLVARWVDRLRSRGPVELVIDPVLAASTGACFADDDALRALREELLPRATLVTPNRREACRLLGLDSEGIDAADGAHGVPALALALRECGARAVCITGGDSHGPQGDVLDWFDGEHARGWLASPRVPTPHHHGTGCTFATSAAAAMVLGFVSADAVVLAKVATTHALHCGHAAGEGAGPVRACPGFAMQPELLPRMSWGESSPLSGAPASAASSDRSLGLYAIVDSASRVEQVLDAGVRTLQLRIKQPAVPDAEWSQHLREQIARSVSACRRVGAELFVNDHWLIARELGAAGVHLGQEDLLALGNGGRAALQASGLALGISTHSLWELCRARSLAPRYIACGPVWSTLTKAMPWQPQGLGNLAWWAHMAGVPVVAIGGILEAAQVRAAATCGVDGVCIVRGLGDDPRRSAPALAQAWDDGRAHVQRLPANALPSPSLRRTVESISMGGHLR